jgi:hypothetical protein
MENPLTRTILVAAIGLVLGACGQSSGGASSASPSATAGAQQGGSSKAGDKKTAVALKYADEQAAYKTAFNDMSTLNDPIDKKIGVFVAKVGKPEKVDDGKQVWHAVDGADCHKIQLHKDGMAEDDTVDKAECGM